MALKHYSKYFMETARGSKVFVPMNLRVLHVGIDTMVQTSTHLRFIDMKAKDGQAPKKRPIRIECLKRGAYGQQRDAINCPMDANEKFPTTKKYWLWVLDFDDLDAETGEPRLKSLELPWSAVSQMQTLVDTYLGGQPLWNAHLQIHRTVNGNQTTYAVYPMGQSAFDLNSWLAQHGETQLPNMVGPFSEYPPIIKLEPQQMIDFENGVMPWSRQSNPTAQAQSAPGQPVHAQQGYAQPAYNQQAPAAPAYNQPAPAYGQAPQQAPAYAQPQQAPAPNYGAPAQQNAPAYQAPVQQQAPTYPAPNQQQVQTTGGLGATEEHQQSLFGDPNDNSIVDAAPNMGVVGDGIDVGF